MDGGRVGQSRGEDGGRVNRGEKAGPPKERKESTNTQLELRGRDESRDENLSFCNLVLMQPR